MPAISIKGDPRGRFSTEPQRALLTPSASPSVGPPDRPPAKRPRLRSTPSSAISATPSTSNESTTSSDVNSARRASTLRVLNTWAQLAERYNKRLDEDDIIDLHRCVIIKDRGAVEGASREYHIGHLTLDSDQDDPDADQDQEDSDQEDDETELNVLPPSETATDDDAPISKKELLHGVPPLPPLSVTTDAEDLREFLEAEKKRRALVGDEEDEEEMSPEQRTALRKDLEDRLKKKEAAMKQAQEPALQHDVDATPTRPSTRVSDNESEDELALWTHDESTAVYPVARDESEQDVREVEREVIELTESESDEEFEALLTHPPRFDLVLSLPIPQPKKIRPPLHSPPDSERGMPKSRAHSHTTIKSAEVSLKPGDRPRTPFVSRKPEVVLTQKRKPSVLKEKGVTMTPDDGRSDQAVAGGTSSSPREKGKDKGKGKEIPPPVEDSHREKTPKSLGTSRGRKRKRIISSSISGSPPAQSSDFCTATPKSTLLSRGKSISQVSTAIAQSDNPEVILGEGMSDSARFGSPVAGPSHSLSSFPSTSKSRLPTPPVPTYRSLEPDAQLTPHDHSFNEPLSSDPPIPVPYPYYHRYPSQSPSVFTSPHHGTLGPLPRPPLDPVQTQQAHYLLAQAMHQLSYLLSTTMPSYAAYGSNPGSPWQHPPPPSHPTYSTSIHHPPLFHGTRHYHTPSSGLPPSSPVRSSVSPPLEERARSRAQSKSRGRRVSFKLNGEDGGREDDPEPELVHYSAKQKHRKEIHEPKRERGKGKGRAIDEFTNPPRLERDRASPPQEVARGRTPGPPNRTKIDVPRGRSLSRR